MSLYILDPQQLSDNAPRKVTWTQSSSQPAARMEVATALTHVKPLRRQLRNLTRQRRRHQAAVAQVWTPIEHVQMKAVVMFLLTGEPRWPIFFVKRWQWRHVNRVIAMLTQINEAVLQEWHMTYGGHDRVQHMLQHLDDADRVAIDVFLIQSLIYEEIETNNNKGPSVPASSVVASFIRKCRFRPEVAAVQLLSLIHI